MGEIQQKHRTLWSLGPCILESLVHILNRDQEDEVEDDEDAWTLNKLFEDGLLDEALDIDSDSD